MSNIVFEATVLRNTEKQGILRPDANGYYEMCIGGLNIDNYGGARYMATKRAIALFEDSSDLQRKINSGNLRGETGHPRREPHMNDQQWAARCADTVEANVCVYWSKIWLDFDYGKNNPQLGRPDMIGIMARFRPGGVRGDFLARDLADPETNVCFSIRSVSDAFRQGGKTFFDLLFINTWDYVNEPGISPANKMQSPTLESLISTPMTSRMVLDAIQSTGRIQSMESANSNLREIARVIQTTEGFRVSRTPPGVQLLKNW